MRIQSQPRVSRWYYDRRARQLASNGRFLLTVASVPGLFFVAAFAGGNGQWSGIHTKFALVTVTLTISAIGCLLTSYRIEVAAIAEINGIGMNTDTTNVDDSDEKAVN